MIHFEVSTLQRSRTEIWHKTALSKNRAPPVQMEKARLFRWHCSKLSFCSGRRTLTRRNEMKLQVKRSEYLNVRTRMNIPLHTLFVEVACFRHDIRSVYVACGHMEATLWLWWTITTHSPFAQCIEKLTFIFPNNLTLLTVYEVRQRATRFPAL